MRIRWTTRIVTAAGLLTLIAGIAANGGPANAAATGAAAGRATVLSTGASALRPAAARAAVPDSTRYVTDGALTGVATVSGSSVSAGGAWAVGYTGSQEKPKTLILHWNGKTWAKAPGFTPVTGELSGIATVSGSNVSGGSAWAVGFTGSPFTAQRTLLLHWNGKAWVTVTTPAPVSGAFAAVTGTAKYAWAAGSTSASAPLIWHWNGRTWAKSPIPGTLANIALLGVAATSGTSAWAGGLGTLTTQVSGLLLHWNGTSWSKVGYPLAGLFQYLNGIAAGPRGTAWAVGANAGGTGPGPISMFWNGKAWAKSPGPPSGNFNAVAVVPGGTAWAVGSAQDPKVEAFKTLIARWTGKDWSQVPSPTPMNSGTLSAVAATSTGSAWAVGSTGSSVPKTLILHWNGKAWS